MLLIKLETVLAVYNTAYNGKIVANGILLQFLRAMAAVTESYLISFSPLQDLIPDKRNQLPRIACM